jgi:FMN phosphatase YigB (HAD superfamily)
MRMVIGVDFDNTIAGYDALLARLALEKGLIGPRTAQGKKAIRDRVRLLPEGEIEWQRLQGAMYGPRMGEAVLIDGVASFFRRCRALGWKLFVVSHKTEYAGYDETRTSLPAVARGWLRAHGFFQPSGLGLDETDVFFEPTRAAKLARIGSLRCTHFIDDLEETFLEPAFPAGVTRILFNPHRETVTARAEVFTSWPSIEESLCAAS